MAKQRAEVESQDVKEKVMTKIGAMNLNIEGAKCSQAVKGSIIERAKKSARWAEVPGNAANIKAAERIFNAILEGGGYEEVQAIYKETDVASSMSQGGPWMPDTVMWSVRPLLDGDIYTVKLDGGVYMEKIEWQLANGMAEPDLKTADGKLLVRPGKLTVCMKCKKSMATPEPLLQHQCPDCTPKGKAGAKGGGKMDERVMLMKDIKKWSENFMTHRGTPIGDAILEKLNGCRSKLGLEEISVEKANAATSAVQLA